MEQANAIPSSIAGELPAGVKEELAKMAPPYQAEFVREYKKNAKSPVIAYILWLLGFHYAYFGKGRLLAWFWLLLAPALIWLAVDGFRIPGMVRQHNRQLANDILRYLKTVSS
ncbi:MAG: hypothetical protein M1531_04665 [Chloroflexi bacterium]|nr:hypothetical protein [Chloroflexota bacterium]